MAAVPLERSSTGTASGVAAALIWSLNAPVVASATGVSPFLYLFIGDGIGALLFAAKWIALRQNPLPELQRVPWWFYGLGLIGIGLHNVTWVAAVQQAPPLEATLIIYTWPLLVILFTTIALGEKFRWYHIAGGLLGLAGIAGLLVGRGLDVSGFVLRPGHLYAIVSALSWSIFSAISARYHYLTSNLLGAVFAVNALISGSIWGSLGAPPAPASSVWLVATAAILLVSGYPLWDFGIKHGNAQLIGAASFLTPVLAAFYLVILGKADLTIYLLIALGLVVAGIGVARYGETLRPNR